MNEVPKQRRIIKFHDLKGVEGPRLQFQGRAHKLHRKDGVDFQETKKTPAGRSQTGNPHKAE